MADGVDFLVNGKAVECFLPRDTPLLAFLRNDLGLNGPKFGCGLGQCGACTVLINGVAARACVLTLNNVEGRSVTTLKGLSLGGALHPVQAAFIDEAGAQCGYCLNGMMMTVVALLRRNPNPSDTEIAEELRYNLCRCGAHVEILASVRDAARRVQALLAEGATR